MQGRPSSTRAVRAHDRPRRGWVLCVGLDLTCGSSASAGRWHEAGQRVLYLAESAAGALLEVRVHLRAHPERLPRNYRMRAVAIPRAATVRAVPRDSLPPDWTRRKRLTRALGSSWYESARSAVLRVPCAVVDDTYNLVLNLAHPALARLRVVADEPHRFDARLFRGKARPAPAETV
jgi:RES domain-containing protein